MYKRKILVLTRLAIWNVLVNFAEKESSINRRIMINFERKINVSDTLVIEIYNSRQMS